jgi:hypothetical protein
MSKDQLKGLVSFVLAIGFAVVAWTQPMILLFHILLFICAAVYLLVGIALVTNDPDWDDINER